MNGNHGIEDGTEQVWAFTHMFQFTRLLCDLTCPECGEKGLSISVGEGENAGFASKLILKCDGCGDYEKTEMSSPRIQGSDQKNIAFEINPMMVMFSHEVGGSYSVLETFSSVMGIPGMYLKTYQRQDKKVTAAEVDAGSAMLQRSASAIREAYAETDEDLREAIDRGENPVVNISVSYDGTWQKRGFTSLYGVGVAIDVLTGLVVDYHVLSKYCHACSLAESRNLPAEELAAWKEEHAPGCCKNHHMSSKAMESEAARILWNRSEAKFGFRYVEMLSDGDSSAYRAVCEENPYPVQVDKLDCTNHAHKRMGTALRKLAKEERLGGRGVGRLTENKCDSLQNFYRGAILDNIR